MASVIGLDWGTSRLRAYLMDARGAIVEVRATDDGAIGLAPAGFESALQRVAGDWLRREPDAALVACGMVGARGGWAEAGYVDLPAGLDAIRSARVTVRTALGATLSIVGGLRTDEPDVLRGEETQALGAGVTDGWLCMPGTHSKWLRLQGGRIVSFRTWFTGEAYQLFGGHGSLAKALGPAPEAPGTADSPDTPGGPSLDLPAFDEGVASAFAGGPWLHELFLFRARVVGAGRPGPLERARLSGWLVGTELCQALPIDVARHGERSDAPPHRLVLVGNPVIGDWYVRALAVLGRLDARFAGLRFERADPDCAARGLFRIATGSRAAGGRPQDGSSSRRRMRAASSLDTGTDWVRRRLVRHTTAAPTASIRKGPSHSAQLRGSKVGR